MIDPLTYLAITFVLVLLVAGAGTYYFTQMRGAASTTVEPEDDDGEEESPLSGSASSMQVTPSGRQQDTTDETPADDSGVELEVVGTREDNALGTVITVVVQQGTLQVGDTVSFQDAEGRVGTLEKQGQSIDKAEEGDEVSFSLIGVGDVEIEQGMVGETQ